MAWSRSLACAALFTLAGAAIPAGPAAAGTPPYSSIFTVWYFGNYPDGRNPMAGVVADAQGRLYGTTEFGGQYYDGIVFRLTPNNPTDPTYFTEEILHAFSGADGANPVAPLVLGSDGTIYGTTLNGGQSGMGTVFSLANTAGTPITVLHSFTTAGPAHPAAGLVFGSDGLLYGTTSYYGEAKQAQLGSNFRISPLGDAVEFQIIDLTGAMGQGFSPQSLIPAGDSLFNGFLGVDSVTNIGMGAENVGPGNVYDLSLHANGSATQAPVFNFSASSGLFNPVSQLLKGTNDVGSAFFGCAASGATNSAGGVYQLIPTGPGALKETLVNSFGQDGSGAPRVTSACTLTQAGPDGTLIGISDSGGTDNAGASFVLYPPASAGGAWTYQQILSIFSSFYGSNPHGPLAYSNGAYYGTTAYGGQIGESQGTVFQYGN
jgi:uncharacterized repeat protein (TIGR03803 family)